MSALFTADSPSRFQSGPYLERVFATNGRGRMSDRKREDLAHDLFYREVGARIQDARIRKGWEEEALALALRDSGRPLKAGTIRRMERYGAINLENISRIAAALDVEPHWLLHGVTVDQARIAELFERFQHDAEVLRRLLASGE